MNTATVLDPARDAFGEAADTRHMSAVHAMPPINGGVKIARVGATLETVVKRQDGKPVRMRITVRERSAHRGAKVVARCLGFRDGPQMRPCPVCQECPAKGETGLDGLREKHDAAGLTESELRKMGQQHVFALFSEDALRPEAHALAQKTYEDRVEALAAVAPKRDEKGKLIHPGDPLMRAALIKDFGGYPTPPWCEPIGLLSDASWDSAD